MQGSYFLEARELRGTLISLIMASLLPLMTTVDLAHATSTDHCTPNEKYGRRHLKSQLQRALNPLADRVHELRWPEYCRCFNEATNKVLEKRKGKLSEKDNLAPEFAKAESACAQAAGLDPARSAAKPRPSPTPTPYFSQQIKECSERPMAEVIKIEAHLKATGNPRAGRVRRLDISTYCACYFSFLRSEIGDPLTTRAMQLATQPPLSGEEIVQIGEAQDLSTEACVAAQLPFMEETANIRKGEVQPNQSQPGGAPEFERVFSSTMTLNKSLGAIELGMSVNQFIAILGSTNTIQVRKWGDEYYYGPTLLELTIKTEPSGPQGKIVSISVNRFFRGQTNNGVKIGEVFESVKQKMLPEKPVLEDRHVGALLYKSGVQFGFADYNSGILRRITIFSPGSHPLLRGK